MDDQAATVEQLRAELKALQEQHSIALAENADLRDQQAGTAEILRVIATSPTGLQRALESTARAALRIVDADYVGISQPRDDELRVAVSRRSRSASSCAMPLLSSSR